MLLIGLFQDFVRAEKKKLWAQIFIHHFFILLMLISHWFKLTGSLQEGSLDVEK